LITNRKAGEGSVETCPFTREEEKHSSENSSATLDGTGSLGLSAPVQAQLVVSRVPLSKAGGEEDERATWITTIPHNFQRSGDQSSGPSHSTCPCGTCTPAFSKLAIGNFTYEYFVRETGPSNKSVVGKSPALESHIQSLETPSLTQVMRRCRARGSCYVIDPHAKDEATWDDNYGKRHALQTDHARLVEERDHFEMFRGLNISSVQGDDLPTDDHGMEVSRGSGSFDTEHERMTAQLDEIELQTELPEN
jgi:hypothetical protein